MIYVMKEPNQKGEPIEWFAINHPLADYDQDAYVPCCYFDDSQNRNMLYWKYVSRADLITGGHRFYNDLQDLAQSVSWEFDQLI